MTWRAVAACAVGTSHEASGASCQDSCLHQLISEPPKHPVLSIFVADGAGSAICGGDGANLAVEVAAELVVREYRRSERVCFDSGFAADCLRVVRERISAMANQAGGGLRDYACTLLGVVATPSSTLLIQIGDGGIVVDFGDGLEVPIAPAIDEYVNMTHFVTDSDALENLKVFEGGALARRVAVFSDGLQRLALNVSSNTAHAPFFNPFFEVLSAATADQEDSLHEGLVQFLNSRSLNDRTDDDKTLALAHWVG